MDKIKAFFAALFSPKSWFEGVLIGKVIQKAIQGIVAALVAAILAPSIAPKVIAFLTMVEPYLRPTLERLGIMMVFDPAHPEIFVGVVLTGLMMALRNWLKIRFKIAWL